MEEQAPPPINVNNVKADLDRAGAVLLEPLTSGRPEPTLFAGINRFSSRAVPDA